MFDLHLGNVMTVTNGRTRSISAENVYGEKGRGGMAEVSDTPQPDVAKIGQTWVRQTCARDLGQTWKVRPCVNLEPTSTTTLMDVAGPGVIRHIWITVAPKVYRDLVLRFYWDGAERPSVEVPVGDFFCNGFCERTNILSLPINVNPSGGFNSYWPMPFRRHVRVTVENRNPEPVKHFFYTINYELTEVPAAAGYFHAQFRRSNPLAYATDYTILDNVAGQGQYVGTYMGWQQNSKGWWGEGEFKAFLDGDSDFPTICGTGTEDYFGGAWGFGANFTAPYLGYAAGATDGKPGNRHILYRFHIQDPIRFQTDIRVTMQALGWRSEGRYLPLQDDICSVAYWYQTEPCTTFPDLPNRDALEVI